MHIASGHASRTRISFARILTRLPVSLQPTDLRSVGMLNCASYSIKVVLSSSSGKDESPGRLHLPIPR